MHPKDLIQSDFATKAIHAGQAPDPVTGAVVTPIYPASTFAQKSFGELGDYQYARFEHPTVRPLEECIASLEGGDQAYAFASGMAAISALLEVLPAGSHVISSNDLYGGTFVLFEKVKRHSAGISFSYVDMSKPEEVTAAIQPNTRLIWLETPTNPLLNIADLGAISAIARRHRILCAADNTFATPLLQRPFDHGFDVVMYSTTKYLNGHSDSLGGALVVKGNKELSDQLYLIRKSTGGILSPFEAFLNLRGLRTLAVRMPRHNENAMAVAEFLSTQPKVLRVHYPGLKSHPHHALAKRQMNGFGGMVSFELAGGKEAVGRFMNELKLFTCAVSLGGVESLISHPVSISHAAVPKATRDALGITDGLLRVSVGIEAAVDLIDDLARALQEV